MFVELQVLVRKNSYDKFYCPAGRIQIPAHTILCVKGATLVSLDEELQRHERVWTCIVVSHGCDETRVFGHDAEVIEKITRIRLAYERSVRALPFDEVPPPPPPPKKKTTKKKTAKKKGVSRVR